ncbi:hypothetical protein PILCRDRAFT_361 [Piloderma croceum F 1598]|uniref:Uncharacterized protein n=1 Tax=Piloderma croceum (strain F 1598) TaxID=765440 RepID=A0A0C3GL37_PILCF|nr:hypothetical protein PILCRDRAFT_361 [Piloderma croceum F 1598]
MSAYTPVIKAEWISAAKQDFLVPDAVGTKILPLPGTSIKQMLEFTLPRHTISVNVHSSESFFSHNSLDTTSDALMIRLRRLPTPAASVVGKLVELRCQAWLDGYQSVNYIHLCDAVSTHFPLWVISFWAKALDLCKMVHEPWVGAKVWLNTEVKQKISAEQRQLAERATILLATLPWDNNPVHSLWCYLGPHWTTGTQQSDLLDILSDRITAQPALAGRLQVKGLALSPKIL